MTDYSLYFLGFDTPAHTAAQAKCQHIFNHAIDAKTKRNAEEMLHSARRSGDAGGLQTAMVLLSEACEHRLEKNEAFAEFIATFEDGELDRESEESMERLLQLIGGARDVDYFKPLGAEVDLYVQTIDGDPAPKLTLMLSPMVELGVPGLGIEDLVDTEHLGITQALTTLRNTYRLAEQTLANFRKEFAPVGA